MSCPSTAHLAKALLAVFCIPAAAHSATPVNVVVILVDDLGWSDLSCQGSDVCETPNIDRLASEGMRFTNGYAAAAVCSPTRAAYLTGRYPARLGLTDWIRPAIAAGRRQWTEADRPADKQSSSERELLCPNNPRWMELQEVTVAEIFRDAGYATGHVGKWHLGDRDWYPERQGFELNVGGCDLGQPPSYFDPYESRSRKRVRAEIDTLEPRRAGEYLTDREAAEAVRFIRENSKSPFFLSVCHYAVHTPIQAKEGLADRYEAKLAGIDADVDPRYAAMVHSVDDAVGRILGTLNETGVSEDTLVIFTSDNGGLLPKTDNAPLRDGKGSPYEGGIRVPWIIRWPGVTEPGSVCETPVITCDIAPTLAEATGALQESPIFDGQSLVPLLRGEPEAFDDRALYWHFPHYREQRWAPYAVVRRGDHKLVRWFEDGQLELFDLAADIGELQNLAPRRPGLAARLESDLLAWLESIDARLPTPNDDLTASAAIASRMERFVADEEVAGVVTLVTGPDAVLHQHAAGWSNLADQKPLRNDSLFGIASMTKPIAATAVMMLQDDEKLSIDDLVADHLPEFASVRNPAGDPADVTIRHLLTHTSGMPDVPRDVRAGVTTLEGLMPHCYDPVRFDPGSRWAYCQSAINTAARVVEVASGRSFPDFLRERLFEPLGMRDTTFYPTPEQAARLATAYAKPNGSRLIDAPLRFLAGKSPTSRDRYPMASGGLFSTAPDYARFCQMILRRGELDGVRYLSPDAVREMTSLQTGDLKAGFIPGSGWGLGWCVVRKPLGAAAPLSPGSFGHGGAYGTQAWIDPVTERAYILMVQRTDWPNSDKSIVREAFLRRAARLANAEPR